MTCPKCGTPIELSADGSRGYCPNHYCHALVVLIPTASDMHPHGDRAAA